MSARKKGIHLLVISAVAAALVFGGIQFINAQQIKTLKKPVKPDPVEEPQWEVVIVPIDSGDAFLSGTSSPFQANEFTQVYATGPSKDCPCFSFVLRITASGDQDIPKLDFEDVVIDSYYEGDYGDPCGFPCPCFVDPEAPVDPSCIACFLNNFDHPTDGYYSTLLRFWIPEEYLSSLESGQSYTVSDPTGINDGGGYMHLSIYNEYAYEVPPPGIPTYHSLYSFTSLDGLIVTKTETGWEIEFNHPLEELVEQYTETYEYYRGSKLKIGERWAQPLTVTTNPVHFRMIWTQY